MDRRLKCMLVVLQKNNPTKILQKLLRIGVLLSKREAELFPVPPYRPVHHSIPTLGKQARSLKQISYFVLSSVILNIFKISCRC